MGGGVLCIDVIDMAGKYPVCLGEMVDLVIEYWFSPLFMRRHIWLYLSLLSLTFKQNIITPYALILTSPAYFVTIKTDIKKS
jgi:hypothetical protein